MMKSIRISAIASLASLAVLGLSLATPGSARAHAEMQKSVPADGAVVPPGLERIELAFSDPMRLTIVKVKRSADGKEVSPVEGMPKAFAPAAQLSVPRLEAGAYEVSWTGVGKDGHVMNGRFSFTVSTDK